MRPRQVHGENGEKTFKEPGMADPQQTSLQAVVINRLAGLP